MDRWLEHEIIETGEMEKLRRSIVAGPRGREVALRA